MKSGIALMFVVELLLAVYKHNAAERVMNTSIKGCEDICCSNSSNIKTLTEAFQNCCTEATKCLLPKQFYNISCREQIMDSCVRNRSQVLNATKAISEIKTKCCGKRACSNNADKKTRRCSVFKIKFAGDWQKFPPKCDLVNKEWKEEKWTFFLKMVSQKCLKKIGGKKKAKAIKYMYPYYTDDKRENVLFDYLTPPAYLVKRKDSYTMFKAVGVSFRGMWLTMILCVTWTLISGIVIWLLDHRSNSLHFPSSFWKGVREGTWWALVTMTTVGYGDKAPKSLLARIYSAVWMIFGMIILSMFTAEIASELTLDELRPHYTILERKVGVPKFSKRFFREELRGAKIIERNTEEDLIENLQSRAHPIDRIVLYRCEGFDDDMFKTFDVVRALKKHYVGIFTNGPSSLVSCVKKMVEEHFGTNESNPEEEPQCGEKHKTEKMRYKKRKRDLIFTIVYVSTGLVVVMFVTGSVWDLMKTRNVLRKEGNIPGSASNAIEEDEIEIKVIKEDDRHERRSMKAVTTSF